MNHNHCSVDSLSTRFGLDGKISILIRPHHQPLLEIFAVHILRTSIISPKHRLNSNRTPNLPREVRPLHLSSRPLVLIFRKISRIRPIIPNIPNRPPGRINHLGQLRLLKHDSSKIPPRPTKVIHTVAHNVPRRSCHARLVNDIPAGIVRRASRSRDPAPRGRSYDADVALLKPGLRALPEDEICGALDVGFGVELGACVGKEGVLVAVEGDGVVALLL
jgi:hypothetical protein